MKVTVLIEDQNNNIEYFSEHGLSLHIENEDFSLNFDFGQSDRFLKNTKKIGINISKVNVGVLSHGHYDHAGGSPHFLKSNKKAKIYMKEQALIPKYSSDERYTGVPSELISHNKRFTYLRKDLEINKTIFLVNKINLFCDDAVQYGRSKIKEDDLFFRDTFEDE